MLKLTNSFCRYLTVTCEKVDYKARVKRYSHLSHIRELRKESCVDFKLRRQFNNFTISQKQSNPKKRAKRTTRDIDELNQAGQMSEPVDVVSSHASYGGTIVVSSDDESSSGDFDKSKHKTKRGKAKNKQKIPPNFRFWERLISDDDANIKFKVVSYNVLAQYLLESHPYLYSECATRDLKWKARAGRLYDEIITLAPDILCLQEVQVNHLSSFYSKFEEIGFKGVFKQKTGQRQDGCAIYFKKSIFQLKEQMTVEFQQPNLPVLNRDNVGLMVKLVPKHAPHTPIVVATTHLLYNPRRADIRLAQMQLLLAEIDRFAFYNNGTESGHLPIILTGDFNSQPDSAVIKLLNEGHVSARALKDSSDWEHIGVTDNCQHLLVYLNRRAGRETEFRKLKIYNSDYCGPRPEPVSEEDRQPGPFRLLFNSGDLWQTLQLSSVYNMYMTDRNNDVTTFQDRWVTADYIYYSMCSQLRLTNRLRLPAANECKVLKHLPNEVFASDHLALAAVFEIVTPRGDAAK